MMQGSTIDLKRVYVYSYALKNIGVRHAKGKNYKRLKNVRTISVLTNNFT